MPIPEIYLTIDEHGRIYEGQELISDSEVAEQILHSLKPQAGGTWVAQFHQDQAIVEIFDEPLVAKDLQINDQNQLQFLAFADLEFQVDLKTLTLDEWDRYHGYTTNGIPFVMHADAQDQFFDLLESFDDDFVVLGGKHYNTPAYWQTEKAVHAATFWNEKYMHTTPPGWELGFAAPAFLDMLPRLKMNRSRILVLGCGTGHDAALFAKEGHIVTAVDFSGDAIEQAKKNYPHLDIQWVQSDLFKLPVSWKESFDVIIEHTCYCAIDPVRRQDLVNTWLKLLSSGGFLMGVFFTFEKRQGPPFGASEWEVRQRLKKNFQFVFWGRWRKSVPDRQGKELFVYAQKK